MVRRRAPSDDGAPVRDHPLRDSLDAPLLRIENPEDPTDQWPRVLGIYETALQEALGSAGVVTGSGWEFRDGDQDVAFGLEHQILLTVVDVEAALPMIRKALLDAGAPADTVIVQYAPISAEFKLVD